MTTNTAYSPYIQITGLTKEQVKKNYVLFLRGFGNDNYTSEKWQNKHFKRDLFSEHKLIQRLSLLFKTYAIGRPEELVNPSGAMRVYINDETWKSDVKNLMEKARCVVILVNDKPNCIWEILEAEHIKKNVVFIINNKEKYDNVCQNISYLRTTIREEPHFFLHYDENGNLISHPYKNSGNSYWSIIREIKNIYYSNQIK